MQSLPNRPPDFPEIEPFTFFREETQQEEKVHLTTWVWQVLYVDEEGGELHQYDFTTRRFHQFKEIDTKRPLIFKMVHALDQSKPTYTLLFNPLTMKLFHFYRNGILENLTKFPRLHIFGYEQNINNKIKKVFFCITPYDDLVITENINLINF